MNTETEELEGLDADEDASLGEYPLDTMLIRHETRTVHETLRRIDKGFFVMDPDFQRDFIWPEDKQSKLIESVLMRIPLPVFYLAENKDGKMVVVDGLQRLSTFHRFVKNELRLRLPLQAELNGKCFEDLSPKLQNRIEDSTLVQYIVDAKVPAQALLDIFERVNSGVALTRQQMRNCLFMGEATKFLKREAATDLFREATGWSLKTESMRDREMVNRFCAFRLLGVPGYRGDMDEFLARALVEMNALKKADFDRLSSEFRTALRNNKIAFGKHAFRKFWEGQEARSVFNASLWDVMTTLMCNWPESVVEARADDIRIRFYDLMNNNYFLDSITLGTNQVNRVQDRFRFVSNAFEGFIHA